MTINRSGEPWTDDDYLELMRLCRQDAPLDEVCHGLGRTPAAVQARAKRLLPLDQRGVPTDRVLTQLRTVLLADEDHDWAGCLAATPPPRPVVNHVHPPAVLTGIDGLQDDELLAMARALAQLAVQRPEEGYLSESCAQEVQRRGLGEQLESAAVQDVRERVRDFLDRGDYPRYPYGATDCWSLSQRYPRNDPDEAFYDVGFVDDEPPW